ncbi:MAG: hypothetical protein JO325_16615 [Solirubrobacterales bacterium]|nr:hypothetical protein [Solirubrobacterales bacterium]
MLERFLTAVLSDPALLAVIRETATRRRANFVAHLRKALGGVRGDVAYVDVGFSGANQEKLQALIDAEGLDVRLHGLYVMADPCPPERVLRGQLIEGFLGSPGDPLPLETEALDRNRLLLELLLLSEDGSTLGIGDDGRPVSAPNIEPERQLVQRRAVHDGIRAYQRHASGYALAGDAQPILTVDGAVGRRIIERFLVEPTLEEARTFAGWVAEDDYNSLEPSPLVPVQDPVLRRLTGPQLAEQPADRVLWPAGANALWQDPLAEAARCTLSQAGTMRVQLNRSVRAPATAVVPLKLGRDGVLIGSISGEGDDLTGVTVFPVLIDGLLRLDALRLSLISRSSGWRSEIWSWSAGDDPAALPMAQCAWVAQDILNVDSESAFVITLASPLPPGSLIQVELHGGFLPGVDVAPRITQTPQGTTISCPPA